MPGSNRGIGAVLAAVGEVKKSGAGWTARCPAHDDRTASLSLNVGDAGKALLYCHAGCNLADIVSALGLTMADLSPADNHAPRTSPAPAGKRKEVAAYPYHDEHGTLLFEAVRFEPKDFRQRRPGDDGRKVWNLDGVRMVPYRLPELVAAVADGQTVYIVEGEKDADTLRSWGLAATCNPMGAGKWGKVADVAGDVLRGARVVILPDDDEPGRKHAQDIAARLVGTATSVKVLPHFAGSKDVTSWKESGGTREKLEEMAADAPIWSGATTAPAAGESPRLVAVSLGELLQEDIPPREFLMDPFLRRKDLCMIFGQRGHGKTWVGIGAACAVASGGAFTSRWRGRTASRVLYIDGELPLEDVQEKFAVMVRAMRLTAEQEAALLENLRIITPDKQPDLIPDLSTPAGRDAAEPHLDGVALVILDNLSTLCGAADENESLAWLPMSGWLLSLRRRGMAVIFLHHSSRAGNPRGHSKREDPLDHILRVAQPSDYRAGEGARFEVTFTKERHRFEEQDATTPFELALDCANGWTLKPLEKTTAERVADLLGLGMSYREVAAEVGCGLATVYRHAGKLGLRKSRRGK